MVKVLKYCSVLLLFALRALWRDAGGGLTTRHPVLHGVRALVMLAACIGSHDLALLALDTLVSRGLVRKIAHTPITEMKALAGRPEGERFVDFVKRAFNLTQR
jgi:hypothetical protein